MTHSVLVSIDNIYGDNQTSVRVSGTLTGDDGTSQVSFRTDGLSLTFLGRADSVRAMLQAALDSFDAATLLDPDEVHGFRSGPTITVDTTIREEVDA